MRVPNIWGQGQLFAFSALDGVAYNTSDFVGMLSGDRLGVRFFSKVIRELAIVGVQTRTLAFKAVTGDYICAVTAEGEENIILYYDTNTVIGQTSNDAQAIVFVEGRFRNIGTDLLEIQDTGDGEFTALAIKGKQFSFAYGRTRKEAEEKVLKGLEADMNAEVVKKLAYYEKHSLADDTHYSELYSKCLSVMKTQLYSQEGKFQYIWSTPNRLPHRSLYLWDSAFHALGFRHLDSKLAEELILGIFTYQKEDGMIPHRADTVSCSNISQPPVIAWAAWKIYEITGNKDFLRIVYHNNDKFLRWCYENRICVGEELFTWNTNENVYNRCDESGVDNSPRFDEKVGLLAIDFACYMANEMRYMVKIARAIGADGELYEQQFLAIKRAVNEKLWDEKDGLYYDYDIAHKRLHKVESIASFLPLFAGLCDEEQAKRVVKYLRDPEIFNTEMPMCSVSKRDKRFTLDMWRGPVWINFNYMIIRGLEDYGYNTLAEEFTEKTLKVVDEWYRKTGVVFEFYDCDNDVPPYKLNRKGTVVEPYNIRIKFQVVRDFGWSCTLVCDLIACRESLSPGCKESGL